ncbi:MAG: SLOG family protein [Eubacteriales bacterium]
MNDALSASPSLTAPALCCAFTGHRFLSFEHQKRCGDLLDRLIPKLVGRGITTFYAGGALGFDTLAAEKILELRDRHGLPLRLILALPCRDQCAKWDPADTKRYRKIKSLADGTVLLSENYFDGCMQMRNRYMVNRANTLIAFFQPDKPGGTAYTVNYAAKQGRKIINLYPYCTQSGGNQPC